MSAEFDVVVVGSGAGGSPVALELARAGARVLVLEKGRAVAPDELGHDEIRMCRRNFFVPYPKDEPHTIRYDERKAAERTAEGWTSNIVGGGTVHYSGFFFRMKPVDMRLRSTIGPLAGTTVADWPIGYQELEPYYARAEAAIGVSGQWKRHPFEEPRSADFPLPPLDEHPFAARIDAVTAGLGLHAFPTPRAILSRPRAGRAACVYCKRCGSYGCPVQAKGSTAAALLPAAVATGRCEVRAQAMAIDLPLAADGRVSGVVYRDQHGRHIRVLARCVVLACSAIETARLLLASQSGRFPSGLANSSGLVGRNLMFSGFGNASAVFRRQGRGDRAWLRGWRSPFVQRSLQDFYFLNPAREGVQKAGTLLFLLAHANPINAAERLAYREPGHALWGQPLKDALRRDVAGAVTLDFETFCEFLPTLGTYVDLDPQIRDRWGMPVARITLSRHPLDFRATELLVAQGMRVLEALEPDETMVRGTRGATKFLQGGTCRFGTDPASSVLNADCRAHELPNLYVTDGSCFPTSGGVPTTLTILANSFRVAGKLWRRMQSGLL